MPSESESNLFFQILHNVFHFSLDLPSRKVLLLAIRSATYVGYVRGLAETACQVVDSVNIETFEKILGPARALRKANRSKYDLAGGASRRAAEMADGFFHSGTGEAYQSAGESHIVCLHLHRHTGHNPR